MTEPRVETIDGQEWLMAKCWAGCWHPYQRVLRVDEQMIQAWRGDDFRFGGLWGWVDWNWPACLIMSLGLAVLFTLAAWIQSALLPSNLNIPGLLAGASLSACFFFLVSPVADRAKKKRERALQSARKHMLERLGHADLMPEDVRYFDELKTDKFVLLPHKT